MNKASISDRLVIVNGQVASPDYVLQDGDVVAITPTKIEGAVRLPSVKDFKAYLEMTGFQYERQGKGDHEIWKNILGELVSINPSKRGRSEIDIGSIKQLAGITSQSFGDQLSDIFSRI